MTTFSHKLTMRIFYFWAFANIAIGIVYTVFDKDLKFLMDYINPIFLLVISAYFGKSGVENGIRMAKQNSEVK